MKTLLKPASLPLLFLAISMIFLIQSYPLILSDSSITERKLNFPDLISLDSNENIIIVENGWKKIVKLNSEGEIQFSIDGGRRRDGFYEAWFLSTDATGYFYIINSIRDIDSGNVFNEQIVRYTPHGIKDRIIADFSYPKKMTADHPEFAFGRIICMKVIDDTICYLYREDNGAKLHRINITSLRQYEPIPIENYRMLIDFTILGNSIYTTTKNGMILKYSLKGERLPFSFQRDDTTVPYIINTAGNTLLFSDIGKRAISAIDKGSNRSVFSGKQLQKSGNRPDSILPKNFSCSQNGSAAIIDESSSDIFLLGADHELKKTISFIHNKKSNILLKLIYFFVFSVSIIIVLYFTAKFLKNKLKSNIKTTAKLSGIVLLFYSLIFSIIGIIVFIENSQSHKQNTLAGLEQLSSVFSASIDAEALKRVNLPSHYMNQDYIKLQNQLNLLLSTNKIFNNSGIYALIYKEHDGSLFYTVDMTGYYGTRYPYTKSATVHRKALQGESGQTTYSDNEGDWMVGVSPIKDANGKITGILEVGTNLFLKEELQNTFIKNILIIFCILFIFCIILTIFIVNKYLKPIASIRKESSIIKNSIFNFAESQQPKNDFHAISENIRAITQSAIGFMLSAYRNNTISEGRCSAKNAYITNYANDARISLNGITGITESIIRQSRGAISEKLISELNLIILNTRRLQTIIENMIKLDTENKKYEFKQLEISALLIQICKTISFSSKKTISLKTNPAPLSSFINADKQYIENALYSLLVYSLSLSESSLVISLEHTIDIEIKICGKINIEDSHFQMMFTDDSSAPLSAEILNNTSAVELFSVYIIIRDHKGLITYQKESNGDTTIILTFPGLIV